MLRNPVTDHPSKKILTGHMYEGLEGVLGFVFVLSVYNWYLLHRVLVSGLQMVHLADEWIHLQVFFIQWKLLWTLILPWKQFTLLSCFSGWIKSYTTVRFSIGDKFDIVKALSIFT